jgi:hypothetical protein
MKGVWQTIQWMVCSPEREAFLSPSRRRKCIDHVRQELGVSERRACRTLGQHRSTQRKVPQGRADAERLTDDVIELADQYGRYGYRMVTGVLTIAGRQVNHKRPSRQNCHAIRLPGNGWSQDSLHRTGITPGERIP